MKTVLVASSKGGVGKTTLSTNLAAHFAVDGKRTVLVDADRAGLLAPLGGEARAAGRTRCCRSTARAATGTASCPTTPSAW